MSWRLAAVALDKFGPSPQRILLWAFASVAAVISAAYAAFAAYMALSISFEVYWAAASVAGGALLLAMILVAFARWGSRPVPSRAPRTRAPMGELAPEVIAELMGAIRSSPKQAATVALVGGFLVGFFPDLLNAARDLIDPE